MKHKKVRKVHIKKVAHLGAGIHHVELEVHNAPELPAVPLPVDPIEIPEQSLSSAIPEDHRHWYDWIVKAVQKAA
jgi:hypothetical protein